MSMHIAQEANANRLPHGKCVACERGVFCRTRHPLNGPDAVGEFTRRLSARAVRALFPVKP